jgi:hypothetical protein
MRSLQDPRSIAEALSAEALMQAGIGFVIQPLITLTILQSHYKISALGIQGNTTRPRETLSINVVMVLRRLMTSLRKEISYASSGY